MQKPFKGTAQGLLCGAYLGRVIVAVLTKNASKKVLPKITLRLALAARETSISDGGQVAEGNRGTERCC